METQRGPSLLEDISNTVMKKSSLEDISDANDVDARSFGAQLSPIFFLTGIFLLNFVSRIILSPLLPTIEKELGISHSQAGFFFFLSSGGYLVGLLSSGLFTSRSTHRLAIVLSIAGVGVAMLVIAAATNLAIMRCGLIGVGFAAGLYLPSAIATITSLVDKRHWGKAIAVHELAPNLAFFISPFIAENVFEMVNLAHCAECSWRAVDFGKHELWSLRSGW
jgi:NNP family nitrate/nitrite transporter-like MFS transporter